MSIAPAIFDGPAYEPDLDNHRLSTQILRVWTVMSDGQWHTHDEISRITGDPQPSVLAQFGHLRKARFGGHTVERRKVSTSGLHEYRLIPSGPLLDGTDRSLDPPSLKDYEQDVIFAARVMLTDISTATWEAMRDAIAALDAKKGTP